MHASDGRQLAASDGLALHLRITVQPLRIVLGGQPPAPTSEDHVLLDLSHSPRGGWWEHGVRVAESDEQAVEYVRARIRSAGLDLAGAGHPAVS
jgi:hypothetical protein